MLSSGNRDILAICVVSTVVGSLLGWIVVVMRRSPFTPIQSFLYAVNYMVARVLWRAKICNPFPVPPDRGAVVVCNHRCPLDPSLIMLTVARAIHWMVAREYCEQPGLRWLLRTCEVIPVRRGSIDREALRTAIRLVRNGALVGIFPEGRINTTEQLLLPGHPGAAMIALKGGVPIVPCYVHGAPYDGTTLGCLLMPASIQLTIGQPIDLSAYFDRAKDREALADVTRQMLTEIARLAGQPDFKPQLAGRFRNEGQNEGEKRTAEDGGREIVDC
jgi:1-acyl-sn-glycerol-3-phosphate acyltransferase